MLKHAILLLCLLGFVGAAQAEEWRELFDGKTLNGWDGDPRFWTVEDGAITGTTTDQNPTQGNTFIIYVGDHANRKPAEFSDFELKLQYRIFNHNSGVQYRSFKLPGDNDGWRIGGYQADFDFAKQWAGTNYGEK
ncbi:MAG: 3-keto-disaccharide hydrolase, partial [Planctomycetota bacterium]